jgi:hypothetical protein
MLVKLLNICITNILLIFFGQGIATKKEMILNQILFILAVLFNFFLGKIEMFCRPKIVCCVEQIINFSIIISAGFDCGQSGGFRAPTRNKFVNCFVLKGRKSCITKFAIALTE